MCLLKVTKKSTHQYEQQVGWKVFRVLDCKLRSVIFPAYFYEEQKWLYDLPSCAMLPTEEEKFPWWRDTSLDSYPSGFHIFLDLKDAKLYKEIFSVFGVVIRKVIYTGAVTYGIQKIHPSKFVECKVAVASRMFITDEIPEKVENVSPKS